MTTRTTPRILIVEDDAENRTAMIHVLENAGYRTIEADSGEKGLHRIIRQSIDIVVSDLRLPQMDGLHLLKRAICREE
jgi:CheY-like chemotaxis protein